MATKHTTVKWTIPIFEGNLLYSQHPCIATAPSTAPCYQWLPHEGDIKIARVNLHSVEYCNVVSLWKIHTTSAAQITLVFTGIGVFFYQFPLKLLQAYFFCKDFPTCVLEKFCSCWFNNLDLYALSFTVNIRPSVLHSSNLFPQRQNNGWFKHKNPL